MLGKFPGNNIWKLSTAKYRYQEVDEFLGNDAGKLFNRQVSLPGNNIEKEEKNLVHNFTKR